MTLRACLLALSLCLSFSLQAPEPSGAGGYATRELRGWTVRVHPELAAEGSDLGGRVLGLLEYKLSEAERLLPAKAIERLNRLQPAAVWKIFLAGALCSST